MKNENNKNMFISVQDLATMLGISRIAVFKRIKKGTIPAQKIGRSYAIPADYANKLAESMKTGALTEEDKAEIDKAVEKVVEEYGETLRRLGGE